MIGKVGKLLEKLEIYLNSDLYEEWAMVLQEEALCSTCG
jgi:hypothetical protein